MFSAIALLLLSIAILWFSAEAMVSQMKAISVKMKLSSLFVGTVFMSFVTTLPELSSSLYAAFLGDYPLAYANTSSVIVNILLVFGLGVLFGSVRIGTKKTQFESIMLVLLSFVFVGTSFVFTNFQLPLLLMSFVVSWVALYRLAKNGAKKEDKKQFKQVAGDRLSVTKAAMSILGVFASSVILIQSIEQISFLTGIDTSRLGLMILATSTSLPEIVTMIVSSKKGEHKLMIGNIFGSSVYNMFFIPIIVGISSSIILPSIVAAWIIVSTLLLSLVVARFKGRVVPRYVGIIFIACFLVYFLSIM